MNVYYTPPHIYDAVCGSGAYLARITSNITGNPPYGDATMTEYTNTHKTQLQRDAMQIVAEALDAIPPAQRTRFVLRLAGLLASYWPASQDMECLKAIAEEARRCGA